MSGLRRSHFVGANNLQWRAQPSLLLMIGDIGCLGNISITVEKYLAVFDAEPREILDGDHDVMVQTIGYSYHAAVREHGMILRYDDNHPWRHHADDHHVHRGNWRDRNDDSGRVDWVGLGAWPLLSQVIEEVADWYHAHRDELPRPDDYAAPLPREPRTRFNPDAI